MADSSYDAIVLAGGRGNRLGGADKATLSLGGATLLQRVLTAVDDACRVVVVGPRRSQLPSRVEQVSEQPPGGGPAAAIAAGLALVEQPVVVVLACDLPLIDAQTVRRLLDALSEGSAGGAQPAEGGPEPAVAGWDAARLLDRDGRGQPLAAAYRTAPLRAAVAGLGETRNAAVRDLVGRLTWAEVRTDADQAWDCDTWSDVARIRELVEGR
ncbi:MAG TPA: NTP transferase domain-containing protein [Nocardioidaceae bacterium]|nr:NTP transferase domain-containing protein [Nocardioidaceae bacterium]